MNGADEVDTLNAAGFSEDEVRQFVGRRRQMLEDAGFSATHIDEYFGQPPVNETTMNYFADNVVDTVLDEIMGQQEAGGERPGFSEIVARGMKTGFQNSVAGLKYRGELPENSPTTDLSFVEELTSSLVNVGLDLPIMVGGAVWGGVMGTATANPAGVVVGAGAGAFAAPAMLRRSLIEEYQKGSVKDVSEFFVRQGAILHDGLKGAVTGAATVTAGSLVKGAVTKLAAEVGTMVTVGKALEGEVPSARDFAIGAFTIFGLKTAVHIAGKGVTAAQKESVKATGVLQNIYAKTGKRPADIIEDAKTNPTIMQDVLSAMEPTGREIPRAYGALVDPVAIAEVVSKNPPKLEVSDATKSAISDFTEGRSPTPERAAAVTSEVKKAVDEHGVTLATEGYVYRGYSKGKPVTNGRGVISTSDIEGAKAFSLMRNEQVAEVQRVEGNRNAVLPIAKILVPKGAKVLDPNKVGVTAPKELERIVVGKLEPTNTAPELVSGKNFTYEVQEYRLVPETKAPETPSGKTPGDTILEKISVGDREKRATTVHELYTQAVDALHPLNRLTKKLADGETLPANLDPYKAMRFMPGTTAKAQYFLDYEVRKFGTTKVASPGLREILEPVRDDLDGLRAYAVSRRAMELSERGIKPGVDVSAAAKVVEEGRAPFGKYGEVFKGMVKFQDAMTQYLVDSGMVSKASFAKMKEANKEYVPFFRLFETEKGGMGGGVRGPIKRIKGSERDIVDPLESIIKNTYLYTQIAEANAARVKLVELAESKGQVGKDGLVEKVKTPVAPIKVSETELAKVAEQAKKEFGIEFTPEELTIFRAKTMRPTDSQIAVFRNGKREVYEVGTDVGRAFNGLDAQSANLLFKVLATPARTLRAGAILNPEFFVKNAMRDTVAATVFSTSGFRPVFDTLLGGMSLATRGKGFSVKGVPLIKKDTAFGDWLTSGGANASIVALDRQYLQTSLRDLTRDTGLMSRATNVAKSPLEMLRVATELAENATRLGEFKRATRGRRDPQSIAEGAFASREITLDFARIGTKMKTANQLVAFFNARIQAYDRMVRGFKDNPARASTLAFATITMPSIALWVANHDDPRWGDIPQWEKDLFWIIMTEDTVYRVPKPFELGVVFGTVPEHLLEAFVAKNPHALADLRKTFMSDSLATVIPNAAVPIFETATNHSLFRNAPVIPRRLEGLLPEYQYTEYTTEAAKALGGLFSGLPVLSKLSPIDIENFVRQWTGGLGTYALKIADKSLRSAGVVPDPAKPDDTLADVPFIKSFVVRHPSASSDKIRRFYDRLEKRNKVLDTVQRLRERGKFEEAEKVQELDPSAVSELTTLKKTLAELSAVVRMVYADPSISSEQKRQIIDEHYTMMSAIAEQGNDVIDLLEASLGK